MGSSWVGLDVGDAETTDPLFADHPGLVDAAAADLRDLGADLVEDDVDARERVGDASPVVGQVGVERQAVLSAEDGLAAPGITEQQLKDAPAFSDDSWSDRNWEAQTHQHYNVRPYW